MTSGGVAADRGKYWRFAAGSADCVARGRRGLTGGQEFSERVRERVALTKEVGKHLKKRLGDNRVMETPVIVQLIADDILEMAMERAGIATVPCVPYEATAGLAMLMLRDHGIISVHFAGLPPGTAALLIKFLPPDQVERFGGPAALAEAVDNSLDSLADVIMKGELQELLLGGD